MIRISRLKKATSEFWKVLVNGRDDVRTATPSLPPGIDSKPVADDLILFAETGTNNEPVSLGIVKNSDQTKEGETRIYARNSSGVEQFSFLLTDAGQLEFGGTGGFLAEFNELKSGFDQLKSDFNASLLHVHGGVTVGAGVTAVITPPITPSTASIDAAKIDEIEVSG